MGLLGLSVIQGFECEGMSIDHLLKICYMVQSEWLLRGCSGMSLLVLFSFGKSVETRLRAYPKGRLA